MSSNPELSQLRKLKFGEEPRITAAILPPPPTTSNITKQRLDIIDKGQNIKQIQSTPIPVIQDANKTSTPTLKSTSTNLPGTVSKNDAGL
jgi:hypothetical protein